MTDQADSGSDSLSIPSENPSDSLSLQLRVDEICQRFESAWQSGQRPHIEDYMSATHEPERALLVRELMKLEIEIAAGAKFHTRKSTGQRFPCLEMAGLWSMRIPEAREQHTGDFAPGCTPGEGVTSIRCPQCHNPVHLADGYADELHCPDCGGSFRVRERQQTVPTNTMRRLGKFFLLERVGTGAFGAGVAGPRHGAGPDGGPENSTCQPPELRSVPGAVSPRGASDRPVAASGHRHRARGTDVGGTARHRRGFR